MPTRRIEAVALPYAGRRHTPDLSRLAALYSRGGEQLADLSVQRGQHTARLFDRLGAIFSGYQQLEREKQATKTAVAQRAHELEIDTQLKREEMAARKAERDVVSADRAAANQERIDARKERDDDRALTAAEKTVNSTRPGVVPGAVYQLAQKWPELAARFQLQDGAPVLMESPDQHATRAKNTADLTERAADNARADAQLKISERMANIAQQNADTRAEDPRTPAKMPAAMAEKVAMAQTSLAALDRLESLYTQDGKNAAYGDAFVGPGTGRYNTAERSLPSIPGMNIFPDAPEGFDDFSAETATLKNQVIQAITGAAVGVQEQKRIMGQIPDLTDPPSVWKSKIKATRRNLQELIMNQVNVGTAAEPLPNGTTVTINPGSLYPGAPMKIGGFTVVVKQ